MFCKLDVLEKREVHVVQAGGAKIIAVLSPKYTLGRLTVHRGIEPFGDALFESGLWVPDPVRPFRVGLQHTSDIARQVAKGNTCLSLVDAIHLPPTYHSIFGLVHGGTEPLSSPERQIVNHTHYNALRHVIA